MNDIIGVQRVLVGFNKIASASGEHLVQDEYILENVDINDLRNIFNVNLNSADEAILDMITPLDVNEKQINLLQKYIPNKIINPNKYMFELHAYQDESYDWSNGYPPSKKSSPSEA